MTIKTLYCDESGYTGLNMLDHAQPVFVLASTDIDPSLAAIALNIAFPNHGGSEYKFSNIWRSGKAGGLIKFSYILRRLKNRVFVFKIEKKYFSLTSILDDFIEPILTAGKLDYYSDYFNRRYTNALHYGLIHYAQPGYYNVLLGLYQNFLQNPTQENLNRLNISLEIAASSGSDLLQSPLSLLATGVDCFPKHTLLESLRPADNLHFASMLGTVSFWKKRHPGQFAIVHDNSTSFSRQREEWAIASNNQGPKSWHPAGDGTMVEFPMGVVSTTGADSKTNSSIQFCDILAGLMVKLFNASLLSETETQLLSDCL